jgi:hypothetical protein
MTAMRARAQGSDPELAADEADALTDAERERLDDALEASWLSARDGTIDADDVLAELESLEPAHG